MSAIADAVLRAGLDDDLPLLAAAALLASQADVSADWASQRAALLEAIEALLNDGLIELGDCSSGRFQAWAEVDSAAVLARLDALISSEPPDQNASWAFAAWISTTARGDEAGFDLVERESCMDDGSALAAMRDGQASTAATTE